MIVIRCAFESEARKAESVSCVTTDATCCLMFATISPSIALLHDISIGRTLVDYYQSQGWVGYTDAMARTSHMPHARRRVGRIGAIQGPS